MLLNINKSPLIELGKFGFVDASIVFFIVIFEKNVFKSLVNEVVAILFDESL